MRVRKYFLLFYILVLFTNTKCSNSAIEGIYVDKNQFDPNAAVFSKNRFSFNKSKMRFEYLSGAEQNLFTSTGKYNLFDHFIILNSDQDVNKLQFLKDSTRNFKKDSLEIRLTLSCNFSNCNTILKKYIELDDSSSIALPELDTVQISLSRHCKKFRFRLDYSNSYSNKKEVFCTGYFTIYSNFNYTFFYKFKYEQLYFRQFKNDTLLITGNKLYLVSDSINYYKFNKANKRKFKNQQSH